MPESFSATPFSLDPGDADCLHRYHGTPFVASDASGNEYILTPIFFSQRQDRTYALRELGGFEWGSKLYASFNADVPKSEFGRYEIVHDNGDRVLLISDSLLAP